MNKLELDAMVAVVRLCEALSGTNKDSWWRRADDLRQDMIRELNVTTEEYAIVLRHK